MKRNRKGFTLIELLAVIIILGVLMLVAVPAVTGYISSSRRSSYASTASSFVKSVGVLVNQGNVKDGIYDTNKLYLFPVGNDETKSCVKLESGGRSPFSNSYTYAYVGVLYDGSNYSYYMISNDGASQGIRDEDSSNTDFVGTFMVSSKRLEDEAGDLIKPGIEKNDLLETYYGESIVISKPGSGQTNANWTGLYEPSKGKLKDAIDKLGITAVRFLSPSDCNIN